MLEICWKLRQNVLVGCESLGAHHRCGQKQTGRDTCVYTSSTYHQLRYSLEWNFVSVCKLESWPLSGLFLSLFHLCQFRWLKKTKKSKTRCMLLVQCRWKSGPAWNKSCLNMYTMTLFLRQYSSCLQLHFHIWPQTWQREKTHDARLRNALPHLLCRDGAFLAPHLWKHTWCFSGFPPAGCWPCQWYFRLWGLLSLGCQHPQVDGGRGCHGNRPLGWDMVQAPAHALKSFHW